VKLTSKVKRPLGVVLFVDGELASVLYAPIQIMRLFRLQLQEKVATA
jgi:hypothetical protein